MSQGLWRRRHLRAHQIAGTSRSRALQGRSPLSIRWTVGIAVMSAVIVSALAPAARAAEPTKGATYERSSFQSEIMMVSFRVSRDASALKDISLFLGLTCSNGRTGSGLFLGVETGAPVRVPIEGDGTFSGSFAVSEEWLDPFAVSEEYSLSGAFIRRGKAARLVVRSQQVGEAGTVCDSGDRRVTVKRKRAAK